MHGSMVASIDSLFSSVSFLRTAATRTQDRHSWTFNERLRRKHGEESEKLRDVRALSEFIDEKKTTQWMASVKVKMAKSSKSTVCRSSFN